MRREPEKAGNFLNAAGGAGLRIKLCGLRTEADIRYVNEAGRDGGVCGGFILSKPFWRCISREEAKQLRTLLDPGIPLAGVFVDEPVEVVASFLEEGIISLAQLHGQEDDEYIGRLRELTGQPLIRAFRVKSREDILAANVSAADLVLLDAGTGSGECFDWSLLGQMKRPYLLAGGLTPENVAEAISAAGPGGFLSGVDVSSGVETDRKKDPDKIRRFVQAVRKT